MAPRTIFLALLSMVFAIGGASWFFEGIAFIRIKRLIENLPTSKIFAIPVGLVEVKGKAKWKKTIYSPISEMFRWFYRF